MTGRTCSALLITAALSLGLPASGEPTTAPVLAFRGAVGFGAHARGGRAGDVYIVTSLSDSGAGSLREGIQTADGPRTIVFEVGGTIDLESPLDVRASRLTIAGQTAPGGIGLRGYPLQLARCEDLVIRYIRVRTSDINARGVPGKSGRGNADLVGDAGDSISVIECERVVLDHVSASWGMDETLSVTRSRDVTVQHSIISESLDESFHTEGAHGFGSLVRGEGRRGYTFFGNLWAHHSLRSPGIGGQQDPPPGEPNLGLDIDIVNNVIYDWGLLSSHNTRDLGLVRVHYVGNTLIAGTSTFCTPCVFVYVDPVAGDDLRIFQEENLLDANVNGVLDPEPVQSSSFAGARIDLVDAPFAFTRSALEPIPTDRAYDRVVREAGASLVRDAVDRRVIRQLVEQTGGLIDSQDDVGGFAEDPPARPPPRDRDRDGMPDEWECRRGLDPDDPLDHRRRDLARRITNLEVYLAELVEPGPVPRRVKPRPGRWLRAAPPAWWRRWSLPSSSSGGEGRCEVAGG